MARFLVLYGTTDGLTAKIAGALCETLSGAGAEADVVDAGAHGDDPNPESYDAVIVAASVHASGYQRDVERWVRAHAAALAMRPTAFVSVCLGVLEKNPATDRALAQIVDGFLAKTGWKPTVVKPVAGALLYRRYNFLKRWLMRRIVAKAGGDTDTSRDYEYTDWEDLRSFAHEFHRRVLLP
ncbi:MAG TPA: flavodoxin domain-containing protein [Candidatus Eisenbacteria bacterium]|nr:flavodoxin domain-containing protein [Candidatus Eisenbacteria bacterium]